MCIYYEGDGIRIEIVGTPNWIDIGWCSNTLVYLVHLEDLFLGLVLFHLLVTSCYYLARINHFGISIVFLISFPFLFVYSLTNLATFSMLIE